MKDKKKPKDEDKLWGSLGEYNKTTYRDGLIAEIEKGIATYTKPLSISEADIREIMGLVKEDEIKEIIETGIKSQILFGEEGYEITDGQILRALTIEEIQKIKYGEE